MRAFKGRSRLVGLRLGEASINTIQPGVPPLSATFALVRDDGELAGRVDKRLEWSERTQKLLGELQASMEMDMAEALFELTPGDRGEPDSEEPSQV